MEIEYFIVEKIEIVDGEAVRNNIGYVTDKSLLDTIISGQLVAQQWIYANIDDLNSGVMDFTDYLVTIGGMMYSFPSSTTCVDGMGLFEIEVHKV